MLDVARGKFGPEEGVACQIADATALPFQDGGYDAVVCRFGVMFFPDKKKAYQEAYRVLAAGGRYLFSVWDSIDHNPLNRLVTDVAAGFCPADPPRIFQVPVAYHRIDPIRDLLDTVGFTDVKISVVGVQKTIADIAAFSQSLVYGGPLLGELRARRRPRPGGRRPRRGDAARVRPQFHAHPPPGNRIRDAAAVAGPRAAVLAVAAAVCASS